MTTFGWDASHYDAPPTARDGIDFYTHKIGEGHNFYRDDEYRTAMNAARALGIPVLGAYYVNHPGAVADQVDFCLRLAEEQTPWWRDHPAWMWQIDAEKFPYMNRAPSLNEINAFGDLLCQRAGVPASSVIAYAPKWLYGDQLRGLRYKLWASNYSTNPAVHYRSAYPGDGSSRWGAYSGQTPVILQYGSRTTIAGQSTCDANAFRGTLAELVALIGGDDMAAIRDDPDGRALVYRTDALFANRPRAEYTLPNGTKRSEPNGLYAAQAAQDAAIAALAAKVGLDAGELEAIKAAAREGAVAGAEAALTPEALAAAIPDELAAEVVQLLGERQAAAERASADVLDGPGA